LECLATKGQREIRVCLENRDLQDLLDEMENRESLDHPVPQVHMVKWDPVDSLDPEVPLDQLGHQEYLEQKASLDPKELQDQLVCMVNLDHLVHLDHQVHQDQLELKDPQGYQALLANQECQAFLVLMVHQANQDKWEHQA